MNKDIKFVFLISSLYLSVVFAGILPQEALVLEKNLGRIFCFFVLLYVVIFNRVKKINYFVLFKILVVCLFFIFISLFRSENLSYAVEKIDAFIFSTILFVLIWGSIYRSYGNRAVLDGLLNFSLFILFLTVVYKYNYGFFDREVRFFLNGPIVFGWLMGMSLIVSIYIWNATLEKKYIIYSFLYFLAILWSQSKGPLLAVLFSVTPIAFKIIKNNFLHNPLRILLISIVLLATVIFVGEYFSSSRLGAIFRIITNETEQSDSGSVGIRVLLIQHAINLFLENPILGIGIGNFKFDDLYYPHNQHVEVFTELGLFAGVINLFFLIISFLKSKGLFKSLIFYFFVVSCFSGDIGYLRFVYSFAIIGLIYRCDRFIYSARSY